MCEFFSNLKSGDPPEDSSHLAGEPCPWTLVPMGHGWSHPNAGGRVRPLEAALSVSLKGIFTSDSLPLWETHMIWYLYLSPATTLWTAYTQGGPVLLAGD